MGDPKPVIPDSLVAKWQRIVDVAARIVDVPSCLVMRTDPPDHSVLVSSAGADNPYEVGQSFELNENLYCHSVLTRRDELVVRTRGRKATGATTRTSSTACHSIWDIRWAA